MLKDEWKKAMNSLALFAVSTLICQLLCTNQMDSTAKWHRCNVCDMTQSDFFHVIRLIDEKFSRKKNQNLKSFWTTAKTNY